MYSISKSEAIHLLENVLLEDLGTYKKNIISLLLLLLFFFLLFLFSIYKMVDRLDICKSLNVNIGIVMKNLGMLKNVPNHLKTKKNV